MQLNPSAARPASGAVDALGGWGAGCWPQSGCWGRSAALGELQAPREGLGEERKGSQRVGRHRDSNRGKGKNLNVGAQ